MRRLWIALAATIVLCSGAVRAVTQDDLDIIAEKAVREAVATANALIEAGRFAEAKDLLLETVKSAPTSPDVLNLLGFTHRKTGVFDKARDYYDRALAINPNHLGALEYRGELFLETGDVAAARADLAALERACGITCEEYLELAEKIAASGS